VLARAGAEDEDGLGHLDVCVVIPAAGKGARSSR
jgi:hypothetical protein